MAENELLEAAQTEIGPLPAWQWGAIIGVLLIGARMVLPGVPGGSFFRKNSGDPAEGNSFTANSGGGIDRRPVAPFAGLPPAPLPQTTFAEPAPDPFDFVIELPFFGEPEGVSTSVPAPAAPPPPPPQKVYLPLTPTSIRALFRDFPTVFRGNPEYWVNALLGQGIPGDTAANSIEWATSFWPAYARTGLPR